MNPNPSTTQVYYRYEKPDGRVVLVDDLDKLPADARDKAERIDLGVVAAPGTLHDVLTNSTPNALTASTSLASTSLGFGSLHLPSFAVGVLGGLGVAMVVAWFAKSSSTSFVKRVLVALCLTAAMGIALSSLYLGWLRKSAGLGDNLLATPTELVDDVKRTMERVEEQRRKQQEQLDALERVQ